MNIKSKPLSRRTALRGMGAMLALPYLDIMGNKTLAAVSNQSDPSRLACFYIPGAINHYNWFPKDTGPNYTLAPSHKPLAKHRDNFRYSPACCTFRAASAVTSIPTTG